MRNWSRYLTGVVVVAGLIGLASTLYAEDCSLELKKVDAAFSTASRANYIVRSTYPKSYPIVITGNINFGGQEDVPKFAEVIDTEPDEYNAKHPARGVMKFGSQHFGFVLDSSVKATDDEDAEEEADEKASSLLSALSSALLGASDPFAQQTQYQAVLYDRLYFDSDHDGDLTDEEVIEAKPSNRFASGGAAIGSDYFQTSFDTIDVTLEVDSKTLDYAFTMNAMSQSSSSFGYVSVSVNSAAYREGEITLAGKKYPVFLIDYNSNGRFDDRPEINTSVRTSNGTIYMTQGDRLYLDSGQANTAASPYGPAAEAGLFDVNKLVCLDGQFYDLTVSPSGDKLSLEPSDVAVGYVSNPNKGFNAVVHGEAGFLKIQSDESGKALLPAGDWKLQSYVIDQTGMESPKKPDADESQSVIGLLTDALGSSIPTVQTPRMTKVMATATTDFESVKVVEGKTVEMLFGPPYRPVVDVQYQQGAGTVSLGMSLVGLGNEVCSSMYVNGAQPGKPSFTITTADGQTVDEGEFEYG